MKTKRAVAATLTVAACAAAGVGATSALANEGSKLATKGFVGVPSHLTGAAGNFAGVPGGGLPWGIGEAKVEIKRSGKVDVQFEDLVFTGGPNTGKNSVGSMRVAVSCMALNLTRTVALSDPFPVTTAATSDDGVGGDADAKTRITLPAECAAPIVFITSPGGAWFAVNSL